MKNLIEKIEKDLILLVGEIEKAGLNTETSESIFFYARGELEDLKDKILTKEKNKIMKKFKISLAVLVPQNYEVEIEAENEEEAIKLAIEDFRNCDGEEAGEIVEYSGAEAQEDFDEDTKSGIDAEEVENE